MKDRTDLYESGDLERALRSVFQSPAPDADFVAQLERELAMRMVNDLDEQSKRGFLPTWLTASARLAGFGILALLLALALIWGIHNLIPETIPGTINNGDSSLIYCPVTPIQTIWDNSGPVAGEFPVWISSWGRSEYANLGPKVMPPDSGKLKFEQGHLTKMLVFVDQQVEGDLVITGRRLDGDEVIYFPNDGQLKRLDESTLQLIDEPPVTYVIPSAHVTTRFPNPAGRTHHGFGPLFLRPGCYQITAEIAGHTVDVVFEIFRKAQADTEVQVADTALATEFPENALLYTVQTGDTLESISADTNVPLEIIVALNDLETDSPLVPSEQLVIGLGTQPSVPPTFWPPTPVTPAPAAEPLTYKSSSDQIRRRLVESVDLWHTLWADAQIRTTSKNETHVEREQVWISQPAQMRWLTGPLGDNPRLARTTNGNQTAWIDLDSGESLELNDDSGGFVIPSDLDRVIFPEKHFAYRGGVFRLFNTEKIAGRQAVAVDWTDDEGHLVDRFWIDAYTGVILRWVHIPKEYPDASGKVIPSEIEITAIAYDIDFPPETFDTTAPTAYEFSPAYGDK